MSWSIARLGSRFGLFLEPYKRRVMHSALGRFCDKPLDLQVGLVEPDGTRRVLPFTQEPGKVDFVNCEQFERFNSITYRGHSEKYNLRFEFNIHSVFYPQDERLCTTPAFYLELRVSPVDGVREAKPIGATPERVELFLRIKRPDTDVQACNGSRKSEDGGGSGGGERGKGAAHINISYADSPCMEEIFQSEDNSSPAPVNVKERIASLSAEAVPLKSGDGLSCTLPVTEIGSGVKWRLVWAAHVDEPVLNICDKNSKNRPAYFRYYKHLKNLDQVMDEAISKRDNRLSLSRRLEKLLEQSPTVAAEHHLQCQSFQSFLANTFWCDIEDSANEPAQWFSILEGTLKNHSSIDEQYNASMFYFAFWPKLLLIQLEQWIARVNDHEKSGGAVAPHDLGKAYNAGKSGNSHNSFTSQNCDLLLLLQSYMHWTGDTSLIEKYSTTIDKLAMYLVWNDRDDSGFPTEEAVRQRDERGIEALFARKYTYLAIKRVAALRAAADILRLNKEQEKYEQIYKKSLENIENRAWWMDHYVMCLDSFSASGNNPLLSGLNSLNSSEETNFGWDAYSIHTGDGLVLPEIIDQPPLVSIKKLKRDITSALRENLTRYGCGHTSSDIERLSISQNLWRDILADYLGVHSNLAQCYWDLQVASNTDGQSLGYCDTYISRYLCFYPRGVNSIGRLLSGPRLKINRLKEGEVKISVSPDKNTPQRWPLVAIADWKAGKVPVCVVDEDGKVTIEGQIDPVEIG